jgi:hypothetical protein
MFTVFWFNKQNEFGKSDLLKEKFLLFIIDYGRLLVVVHINVKKYTQFNCFLSVLIFFVIALKNT